MPEYSPNMSYKYDDEDYSTIIAAQVKHLGLTFSKGIRGIILDTAGKPILLDGKALCYWDILVIHEIGPRMTAKINAFEEGLQYLSDWTKVKDQKKHSLLIPMNFITGHWALLIIDLDLALNTINIILFDSAKTPISDLELDLKEVIDEIGERVTKVFEIDRCATQIFKLQRQTDDVACGVMVANSICRLIALELLVLQGGSETELSQTDIYALRAKHIELVGEDFAKKQNSDIVLEIDDLAKPSYTADAETELEISKILGALIDKIATVTEKFDLYKNIINFISSDPTADSVAAIKSWLKANYHLLLEVKILEKIFEINEDTTPDDDLTWRRDGGKDTLEKILKILSLQMNLISPEEQEQGSGSSDSETSDDEFEERTEISSVTNNCILKGFVDKDKKLHGLCREKFYDVDLNKYCTFTGTFFHGNKVHGIEECVHQRFGVCTYFKGTFKNGSFWTGNLCCIIGDDLLNSEYIVGFQGKLEHGRVNGLGFMYVFSDGNAKKYKTVLEFSGSMFKILYTELLDMQLQQQALAYFANNLSNFRLRSNSISEDDLVRIRNMAIMAPMPAKVTDYKQQRNKRPRQSHEPDAKTERDFPSLST